ncbi:MAG: peptidoglycan DD-metalloendopeptidase family protein [Chloroflexota bacterium]
MSLSGARLKAWAPRALPTLIALIGLLAGAWATWLNLAVANAARSVPPTEATAAAPADPAEVELPQYTASLSAGLSRLANPHTTTPRRARVDVVRYTVQPGDSVFGIADRFGLKPESVLWGNYEVLQDDPHLLRPGHELNILPVDGTYYQWQAGDSLQAVADFFGVEPEAIADWPSNGLDPENPLIQPGQWLVVPGGRRALRTWVVPTIARGRAGVGAAYGAGGCRGDYSGGAVGTGGFIWPTPNHYLSGNDYWSGHLAIDIAASQGSPVWAADSGVVVFAGGAVGGYGNMVMIDHGNGWQTLYAHLSVVSVGCGQSVTQGQRIGSAGSTGNSTGAHLHFETRYQGGFVNPWYVLP